MQLRVNGELRQESHSSRMSVTIPEILSNFSALGYSAGDVLSTGTVAGVAGFKSPEERARLYLKPGDVIEAEIERIGVLRNPIVSWQDAYGTPAAAAHPSLGRRLSAARDGIQNAVPKRVFLAGGGELHAIGCPCAAWRRSRVADDQGDARAARAHLRGRAGAGAAGPRARPRGPARRLAHAAPARARDARPRGAAACAPRRRVRRLLLLAGRRRRRDRAARRPRGDGRALRRRAARVTVRARRPRRRDRAARRRRRRADAGARAVRRAERRSTTGRSSSWRRATRHAGDRERRRVAVRLAERAARVTGDVDPRARGPRRRAAPAPDAARGGAGRDTGRVPRTSRASMRGSQSSTWSSCWRASPRSSAFPARRSCGASSEDDDDASGATRAAGRVRRRPPSSSRAVACCRGTAVARFRRGRGSSRRIRGSTCSRSPTTRAGTRCSRPTRSATISCRSARR